MISKVIGTAGHIDHGKTTLVRALTGVDTDRLKEEKERKISIDIGFAPLDLPGGLRVAVVDVPGHERFVKNMLAGVGGIDAVLFTIAADEGVMPQTEEHLEILHFLDVRTGVIALTKSDLADEEMRELVMEDVREAFAGTSLADAPIIQVSAVTGEGLSDIKGALLTAIEKAPARETADWFRQPVDRVFSSRGFGTVTTGTVWSGRISTGDKLEIVPGGRLVRVRKVEVFHEEVDEAHAGQRTALALHGVGRSEVSRGDQLVTPGVLAPSHMVDVRLRLSPRSKEIVHRQRVRVHHGAAEILGRVIPLENETIEAGSDCLAQLRLETAAALATGDRIIIRTYSPARTIAGAIVIDPDPPKRKRGRRADLQFLSVMEKGDRPARIEALLEASREAQLPARDLASRLRLASAEVEESIEVLLSENRVRIIGGNIVREEMIETLQDEIVETVKTVAEKSPLQPGVPRETIRKGLTRRVELPLFNLLLKGLEAKGMIMGQGELILFGRGGLPPEVARVWEKVETLLEKSGFTPPSAIDLAAGAGVEKKELSAVLDLLSRLGKVVRIPPGLIYRAEEIGEITRLVRGHIESAGEIDIAAFKQLTGLSRKYSVPILEYFDGCGFTRREDDRRIPGRNFNPDGADQAREQGR